MKPETSKWIIQIIEWTLILTLIAIVIYAQIQGKYINKQITIIETCNGIPTPEGLENLYKIGIINQTIYDLNKQNCTNNTCEITTKIEENQWKN